MRARKKKRNEEEGRETKAKREEQQEGPRDKRRRSREPRGEEQGWGESREAESSRRERDGDEEKQRAGRNKGKGMTRRDKRPKGDETKTKGGEGRRDQVGRERANKRVCRKKVVTEELQGLIRFWKKNIYHPGLGTRVSSVSLWRSRTHLRHFLETFWYLSDTLEHHLTLSNAFQQLRSSLNGFRHFLTSWQLGGCWFTFFRSFFLSAAEIQKVIEYIFFMKV